MGGLRPPSHHRQRDPHIAPGADQLMSSRGKKKTTMAKLNREARLRDRRNEKQARKDARREAAAASSLPDLSTAEGQGGGAQPGAGGQTATRVLAPRP